VKDHGKVVAEIPNRALADEAPLYDRPHTKPARLAPLEAPKIPDRSTPAAIKADLIALLSSGDLCSKRWIWEQYDYLVRSSTLAGPTSDAAIIRIKETGTSIAMSLDGNGRYCALDAREGTKLMVAECCRNVSTSGALPVAATNNLNFGNPERPEIMAQLVESIEGMAEACEFFETPITGGNVSLYNETLGEAIWPTPVMGIVGLMKTAQPTPIHFPQAGLDLVLLGGFGSCDERHFGGTQYAKVILESLWGLPPRLDMAYEKRVHQAIREILSGHLTAAAHDISDGGLAIALCESSFGAAGIGARIEIPSGLRSEFLLFHEGPSRILVATSRLDNVLEIARKNSVEALRIGVTMKERLRIDCGPETLLDCDLTELRQPWETSLERLLHQQ
jgi:phosphoribosylformylglycinamidine (FGAM) synthase-like enzyme